MNHISYESLFVWFLRRLILSRLDTIGIAGFSHDFGSLDGKHNSVTEVFGLLSTDTRGETLHMLFVMLAMTFPSLLKLPTPHSKLVAKLNDTMGEISNALLTRSRKEKEAGTLGESEEKSIIGLLSMSASPWMFGVLTDLV